MRILDRYASAVHSSNLASDPRTTYSDSDVLGAAGLAGRTQPLAMLLQRMFMGDKQAGRDAVITMTELCIAQVERSVVKGIKRVHCQDIARAVLAWHRDGVCKACGGHGYALIHGTKTIGEQPCGECRGTGKVLFERQFRAVHLPLALWLLSEVQRESAKAGPAAMAKLAERIQL